MCNKMLNKVGDKRGGYEKSNAKAPRILIILEALLECMMLSPSLGSERSFRLIA